MAQVLPVEITEELKQSFINYAMSVIVDRALPDVRDGLKPVQRRILFGAYQEGVLPGRKHVKSAKIVGEVMGKYHPHGDAAIYDALGDEKRLRVERSRAVGRDVDLDEIESQVQEQIASVRENVQGLERMLDDLRRDEESLESKIEKRRAELERSEKRLSALQQVRPAYMDEYEQLEAGVDEMYDAYVEKVRKLD